MEKIKNLLNQVAIISKKNTEILNATGGRFNMFRVCGVNHYENTHSAIIAELLNPDGTHDLKSKLLECFIETLGEYFTIQNFNCQKVRVRTEHSTEEGRIDILIEDNQKKAIIIENKINANDQLEQLKRYNKYAEKTYSKGNYQILYLTLSGDVASDQSGGGVGYIPISYQTNIIAWLEKCVCIAVHFPMVRETINQYINHIKSLTNQDMNTKNREEITEVLSKVENLRAAQVISQNYSATFDYIIEKQFNPKMEEFAKQKGLEYHYEKSDEWYVTFHLTNPLLQGKYWIKFSIWNKRYFYGIYNDLNNYKISEENRKMIHEHLKTLGISSPRQSDSWAFEAWIQNLTLDAWENDIIRSDNFLNDCKEKIEQLLKAMKDIKL
jgi:hypothetical protein